jgi:hypothetical protein
VKEDMVEQIWRRIVESESRRRRPRARSRWVPSRGSSHGGDVGKGVAAVRCPPPLTLASTAS